MKHIIQHVPFFSIKKLLYPERFQTHTKEESIMILHVTLKLLLHLIVPGFLFFAELILNSRTPFISLIYFSFYHLKNMVFSLTIMMTLSHLKNSGNSLSSSNVHSIIKFSECLKNCPSTHRFI